MTAESFDRTLQAYRNRQPFRTFMIRFMSGHSIEVNHPEAVMVRAGTAVYFSPKGVPTLFDHESVSEVVGEAQTQST